MKNLMRVSGILAFAALFASAPVFADVIDFVSGTDDGCKVINPDNSQSNCNGVTSNDWGTWISEGDFNSNAGSSGAEWVQADGSFQGGAINDYRIFELDLNKNGMDMLITSLWLSVDDSVIIRVGGVEIWNSSGFGGTPWKTAINVIAYTGAFAVDGNQRLNFYVHDIGDGSGPTGIIFAGTATSVPEPGTLALLGLGLLGMAARRKKSA